jgi:crotonobetainyl-CoA:carnitine CoA-transferase CaiB-like acyl-CoA transferase
MILGDLGASVIKVERPDGGDETRGWGPPFDERGESAYFLSCNRNKKSLVADLRSARDVDLLRSLMAEADVVVENFLPNVLARRGLAPHPMLERHPRLVWCTISGFGSDSTRPGYDFVIQAEMGWMAITGPVDGPPSKVGVAMADIIAGKDAAIAIIAALLGRERRAGGDRLIHVSLADSARAALMNVAQNALVSGREAKRWGNGHANLVPYQLFDASDRPLVIAVGSDAQWMACAKALGLSELAADESLASNAGRLAARDRVVRAISERVGTRPAQEWISVLENAGVPCGVVRSVLEALDGSGASALTGVPPGVHGSVRLPPPQLDEHGEEIRRSGWAVFGE